MGKNHEHDCNTCIYLGSDSECDYYYHYDKNYPTLSTLIARYGEFGDYSSGLDFVMSNTGINMALKLAVEQNVLSEEVKQEIRGHQAKWVEYCKRDPEYAKSIEKVWVGKERFVLE
jgi:hypothetical protein